MALYAMRTECVTAFIASKYNFIKSMPLNFAKRLHLLTLIDEIGLISL